MTQLFRLEMKFKFFQNTILQAKIRSQSAEKIFGDAVYKYKLKKKYNSASFGGRKKEFYVKMG